VSFLQDIKARINTKNKKFVFISLKVGLSCEVTKKVIQDGYIYKYRIFNLMIIKIFVTLLTVLANTSCTTTVEDPYTWKTIEVTATAYNSLAAQTNSHPQVAAFGDSLKPGMKCIAVSRNLLALGLKHNTPVKIEGLEGIYLVKDKMNSRWVNKIDIYMGTDIKAADDWGKKKIDIQYGVIEEEE
jgi:3D (Asp-Asp-Asp) domain-containing protein